MTSACLPRHPTVAYLFLVRPQMKHSAKLFGIFVGAALYSASAGQPDARFEGVWIGTETFQAGANMWQKGQTISKSALIAIADPKKEVGVVQGVRIGRYMVSDKFSGGNALVFTSNGPIRFSKLVLSADGNSFTETGQVVVGEPDVVPAALGTVTGTFHRQRKK